MKVIKLALYISLFSLGFASCNKTDSVKPPITLDSTAIFGFKDSTLLIKSISQITYDSASGTINDSGTVYYYYDTSAKKAVISLEPVTSIGQSYDGEELSYNASGLLSHVAQKYTGSISDPNNFSTADYVYDAANVIQSASVKLLSGYFYTITFNKIALASGGYQLNWIDTSPNSYPANTSYVANFDNNGKLLSYYYSNTGQPYFSDSLIYDASGNISKIMETDFPDPNYPDSSISFTRFDFVSRDTKGDQLYNLNQIIYNGIANLPVSLTDAFTGRGDVDDYAYQSTKYPALKTTIHQYDPSGNGFYYVDFNGVPQYDSKSRLVKYRMFFDDVNVNAQDNTITYYK